MMGAGKTTLGGLLAERLGAPYASLDGMIAAAAGKDIPRIFAEDGEDEFRRQETAALAEILAADAAGVIDTGGGIVDRPANRELLAASSARRIYLQAPAEILAARIGTPEGRPMLVEGDLVPQLAKLLERRDAHYRAAATIVFPTAEAAGPEEAAAELARLLQE